MFVDIADSDTMTYLNILQVGNDCGLAWGEVLQEAERYLSFNRPDALEASNQEIEALKTMSAQEQVVASAVEIVKAAEKATKAAEQFVTAYDVFSAFGEQKPTYQVTSLYDEATNTIKVDFGEPKISFVKELIPA